MAHHGAECGECKRFIPARFPSGRVNRKHYGQCTYVVQWPAKLPITISRTWKAPEPMKVWIDTLAEDCPCFEMRAGASEASRAGDSEGT